MVSLFAKLLAFTSACAFLLLASAPAWAQAPSGPEPQGAPPSCMTGEGGPLGGMMVPLILMFAVFYFLLIRPQQKRAKEHKAMLEALKKGDEVVTSGGLYGKVTGLTDSVVTLEVADKVRVKVNRAQISESQVKKEDAGGK